VRSTQTEGAVLKADPLTRRRARELRAELTDAEKILWSRIKGRQLRGWQFRVQHPVAPYIVDFACVPLKLAIEVDGATHSSAEEREHDERRRRFLESRGWCVLRFWNDDVYRNLNGVLESIMARLPPKAPERL
jgi:very-short-patch-repair endonuclease